MKKGLIVICIICVVAVAGVVGLRLYQGSQPITAASLSLDTALVSRGDIEVLVHGTGTIEVDVMREVYSRVSGRVHTVFKEDGDSVEAGELIALLESETLQDSLRDQTDDLYLQELELASQRTGKSVTTIRAPMAGRVKLLHAEKGDDMTTVQKQHGALAVLSTDGTMRVTLPAPTDGIPSTPMDVKVHIGGKVESGTLLSADDQGMTVTIPNDTYDPGETALVKDENGKDLGSGTLVISRPVVVAGVTGTIKSVEVKENDKVKSQDRLFTLEDDSLSVDVEKKLLSRDQQQRQLDDTREKLTRLEIRAPISGVVANLAVKEGATVQDGQQIGLVIQTDRAKMRLAVDELDIARVFPGQPARLKVDAIPGKQYETTVERVLPVGSRAGEITSYDVLLYMDAQDNMLPYMSISGDILVSKKEQTIVVPASALQVVNGAQYVMLAPTDADLAGLNRRTARAAAPMAMMSGQGSNGDFTWLQESAPQLLRRVQVGLISTEYVEITEGLREGETIVLPRSGSNMFQMMRMGGGGDLQ